MWIYFHSGFPSQKKRIPKEIEEALMEGTRKIIKKKENQLGSKRKSFGRKITFPKLFTQLILSLFCYIFQFLATSSCVLYNFTPLHTQDTRFSRIPRFGIYKWKSFSSLPNIYHCPWTLFRLMRRLKI